MAHNAPGRKARPLSPHLQIWRWGPAMFISIMHRATGNALAVGGIVLLLVWLGALAAGPDVYALFQLIAGSPVGLVVLFGISLVYFWHLVSGIRHFILNIGAGFEVKGNNFWSSLVPVFAILLTAAFWAAILLR